MKRKGRDKPGPSSFSIRGADGQATVWGKRGGRPLIQMRPDEFLRQLDHRGHVDEGDLVPLGVGRGGSQSGGSAGRAGISRLFAAGQGSATRCANGALPKGSN
jgi:hypothetical protein